MKRCWPGVLVAVWLPMAACTEETNAVTDGALREAGTPEAGRDIQAPTDGAACAKQEWVEMPNYPTQAIKALWGSGPNNLYTLSNNTDLMQFNGASWNKVLVTWTSPASACLLQDIWGSGPNNVYSVGYRCEQTHKDLGPIPDASALPHTGITRKAIMLHSDGTGWGELPIPDLNMATTVWGPDSKHVYILGQGSKATSGAARVLRYDGKTWQHWTLGYNILLNDLWGTGSGDIWVVGEAGAVYRFDGTAWKRTPGPGKADLNAVWGTGPDSIYVAGDGLFRFDGKKWHTLIPTGNRIIHDVWGSGPKNIFIAGKDREFSHYTGGSWKRIWPSIHPNSSLNSIWGKDQRTVFIGGKGRYSYSNGVMLKLTCQ